MLFVKCLERPVPVRSEAWRGPVGWLDRTWVSILKFRATGLEAEWVGFLLFFLTFKKKKNPRRSRQSVSVTSTVTNLQHNRCHVFARYTGFFVCFFDMTLKHRRIRSTHAWSGLYRCCNFFFVCFWTGANSKGMSRLFCFQLMSRLVVVVVFVT